VGHLGKDPEVRHLDGGVTVASFPLATSETYTKDGKKIEQTEWHNIVMWRGLADIASKYLQKGKLVYIEGKLRTRSFEDKEGHKKYTTEIVAENFTMLGRKSDFEGQGENNQQKLNEEHGINSNHIIAKEDQPMNYDKGIDDDLPF
jgi:single-strand DNA-binding protein